MGGLDDGNGELVGRAEGKGGWTLLPECAWVFDVRFMTVECVELLALLVYTSI